MDSEPSQHGARRKRHPMVTVLFIVLAILFVVVVVFAGIVAMQPSEFRVTRSATMPGPAEAVFAQVNNLHNWQQWSPWAKLDPQAQNTYNGPDSGEGAIFQWIGSNQVGEGKMTIVESRPHELVKIKLEFLKPFAATNTAEFRFRPNGDRTDVTWTMYGTNNFMSKAIHLALNMDKMVGGQFEEGLANMKSVLEAPTRE